MIGVKTLFSGSSGNCTLIDNGGRKVLIDAGVSATAILKAIGMESPEAIFITHEHTDHIKGLEVLCKRCPDFPVYMSVGTAKAVCPAFPELAARTAIISASDSIEAAGLEFTAFATPHDAAESLGYTVSAGGKKLVGYATDIGHISSEVESSLTGCRAVVIESNHDEAMLMLGRYPYSLKRRIMSDYGHLSNENCGKLMAKLAESGTDSFILAHLSKENNLPELALASARLAVGEGVKVCVAPRNTPSEEYYA